MALLKDKIFYRHTKQSYARFDKDDNCVSLESKKTESIMIGIYPDGEDNGTTGEFEISWIPLSGKSTPQIRLFDDAWQLFTKMPELFQALSSMAGIDATPNEIESMLIGIGYTAEIT